MYCLSLICRTFTSRGVNIRQKKIISDLCFPQLVFLCMEGGRTGFQGTFVAVLTCTLWTSFYILKGISGYLLFEISGIVSSTKLSYRSATAWSFSCILCPSISVIARNTTFQTIIAYTYSVWLRVRQRVRERGGGGGREREQIAH